MAWRKTILTSYLANSTPVIKAFDLVALQQAIVDIFNGAYSFIAVTADGVGDVAVTAVAGQVKGSTLAATSAVSANAAPTTVVPLGNVALEGTLIGWAVITPTNGTTTLVRGYNVKSVAWVGGTTANRVTFNVAPANPTKAGVLFSPLGAGAPVAGDRVLARSAEAVTSNLVVDMFFAAYNNDYMILAFSG